MVCTDYQELTPVDKVVFVGQLLHAAQSDNYLFQSCQKIIKIASLQGLYENVTILPNTETPNNEA